MTIIDKTHAAQLVTKKGKQFKFDAIECLVWNINEVPELAIQSNMLVTDYQNPGEMLLAEKAFYIISKGIKSPMGANLSAVGNEPAVETLIQTHGGERYNWAQLKDVIEN